MNLAHPSRLLHAGLHGGLHGSPQGTGGIFFQSEASNPGRGTRPEGACSDEPGAWISVWEACSDEPEA